MKKILSLFLLLACISLQAQSVYYDASNFLLLGKVSAETETLYERLPAKLKGVSRDAVWSLGKNTAGLSIRFSSNSTSISVKWTTVNNTMMNHMPLTGIRGVDLYALEGKEWRFVNTGRPKVDIKENEAQLISNMSNEMKEYMLYLPLYDGVSSVEIGVDAAANIGMPEVECPIIQKPIIAYGTSILQGGCASRPGMAHTNILSRWLNRELINLGFSGNGKLDYEIAELMAEREASIFIIDCMPNVEADGVIERLEKFYKIIRNKHPETPILFIENPMFPFTHFDMKAEESINKKNEEMHIIFQRLKETDSHIYIVLSEEMMGFDNEATVDGIHFTDLGFIRYAEYLYPKLNLLLQD